MRSKVYGTEAIIAPVKATPINTPAKPPVAEEIVEEIVPEEAPSKKVCMESSHDPAGSILPFRLNNFSTRDCPGKNEMVVTAPEWVQEKFQKYVAWINNEICS
jgi:hypothetical protein